MMSRAIGFLAMTAIAKSHEPLYECWAGGKRGFRKHGMYYLLYALSTSDGVLGGEVGRC